VAPEEGGGLTRKMVEDAVEKMRNAPYQPYVEPPIHPKDYADAKAWRGGDEPLTVQDYWRWRSRHV
jgi:hypothetical protein